MTNLFFLIITAVDLAAIACAIAISMQAKAHAMTKIIRIGIIVGAIGSLSQAGRNLQFMLTGTSPTDADLPLWAMKDIGLTIIIFGLYLIASGRMRSRINDQSKGTGS